MLDLHWENVILLIDKKKWNVIYIVNTEMHVGATVLHALDHIWLPTYRMENT
jgi:hypothetical protein